MLLLLDIYTSAYVITDTCIKDSLCVDACPVDCIRPKQDESGFDDATMSERRGVDRRVEELILR